MLWYLPGIYLAIGMAVVLMIDAGKVWDVIKDAADLLFGWLLWPFVLIGRARWAAIRRGYDAAAKVRRQEALSNNYLQRDFDGWWAGRDMFPDARPIVRARDAR